ncbi:hypothetical protein Misp01_52890 [Microtetraspora sp. NBRC 13810]|nr:hypothetical protein Misp01_52890 [Microtetraspora sp. NBRC 13810]
MIGALLALAVLVPALALAIFAVTVVPGSPEAHHSRPGVTLPDGGVLPACHAGSSAVEPPCPAGAFLPVPRARPAVPAPVEPRAEIAPTPADPRGPPVSLGS